MPGRIIAAANFSSAYSTVAVAYSQRLASKGRMALRKYKFQVDTDDVCYHSRMMCVIT